jgi:hypothetical protein
MMTLEQEYCEFISHDGQEWIIAYVGRMDEQGLQSGWGEPWYYGSGPTREAAHTAARAALWCGQRSVRPEVPVRWFAGETVSISAQHGARSNHDDRAATEAVGGSVPG